MSDEMKVRKLLLKCFNNGFNARHAANLVEEKFDIRGYASRTCQRWFKKFRDGDFDLSVKPKHYRRPKRKAEKKVDGRSKAKAAAAKDVKVEKVIFQQENRPDNRTRTSVGNAYVQKLIQTNRGITVSKVKPSPVAVREPQKRISHSGSKDSTGSRGKEGTIRVKEPSVLMSKRISLPLNKQPLVPATRATSYSQRRSASVVLQQRRPLSSNGLTSRSQSRLRGGLKTDLRLPPSIAKRMATTQISTENHTIGEGPKSAQKTGETVKKSITVQFQNISPEVAKNTVRRSTESRQSSSSGNKKQSTQSSNPLASPKGVIYLNPQEIFGEQLKLKNPPKKTPTPVSAAAKPTGGDLFKRAAKPSAPAAPQAPPVTVTVDDSDSEDDLLFPEDVSIPPPKVKAVVDTFTTYWDMETDKPILLNPSNDMVPTPAVIELE